MRLVIASVGARWDGWGFTGRYLFLPVVLLTLGFGKTTLILFILSHSLATFFFGFYFFVQPQRFLGTWPWYNKIMFAFSTALNVWLPMAMTGDLRLKTRIPEKL